MRPGRINIISGCILSFSTIVSSQAQEDKRPNIIFLMADDLGIAEVGYTGFNEYIITPNIDKMVSQGIRFDRFYSQAPVCSPTRGSVLTGRHPFRYGIFEANIGCLRPEEVVMPEVLGDIGYTTGHFGKWHLGEIIDGLESKGMCEANPLDFGYDEFYGTHHSVPTIDPNWYVTGELTIDSITGLPLEKYLTNDVKDSKELYNYLETIEENGEKRIVPVKHKLYGDDSRIMMNEAIDFIDNNKEQPFFTTIWFHTPHEPVYATEEHKEIYRQTYPDVEIFSGADSTRYLNYYGAVTAMDEQIGRLRDSLEQWGLSENTMIWFTSDNGPTNVGTTGIYRGAKRHLFEGGVRVPGVLVWPDKIKESRVETMLCSTTDYFPTIIDALGLNYESQATLDGISLMPLIENEMDERPDYFFFQSHGSMVAANNDYKLMRAGYSSSVTNALDANIIENEEEWMLFDMHDDSTENNNKAYMFPELVEEMKTSLALWMDDCYKSFNGSDYENPDIYTPNQNYRFNGGVKGSEENFSDTQLGAIYINGVILENFHPQQREYSFPLIENEVLDINAIPASTKAKIDNIIMPVNINGDSVDRSVKIVVKAADNTLGEYNVEIIPVEMGKNNFLKEIYINDVLFEDFSAHKLNYQIILPHDINKEEVPFVNALAYAEDAEVSIVQAIQIIDAKDDKRTAIVSVKLLPDSLERNYSFVFSVGSPSHNTLLKDIKLNGVSISDFSPYICTYYVPWNDEVDSVEVTGLPQDIYATTDTSIISLKGENSGDSHAIITVCAENGFANWAYEVIFYKEEAGTGSKTMNQGRLLSVFPNPCSDMLTIKSSYNFDSIILFDSAGKQLPANFPNNDSIDVSGLQKGVYFLTLNTSELRENLCVKFIKL